MTASAASRLQTVRPKLFALPTRAELKRAALLSLIVTALCLVWPIAALAQAAGGAGDQDGLAGDAAGAGVGSAHEFAPVSAAARSMNRARATSLSVTPSASWVVSSTSTRS